MDDLDHPLNTCPNVSSNVPRGRAKKVQNISPWIEKSEKNPKVWSSDPCLEFFHNKQQKRKIFSNLFTIFVFYHFLSPFWVILIKNSIYFKKGKTWNGTQTRITRGTCLLAVAIIYFLSRLTTSNINSTQVQGPNPSPDHK